MAAVMIGVDPHKGSHTAVAIGAAEEPLAELRVRASAAQAERLLVGFQNSATDVDLVFYAARSYSLMRPPRTGRRLICSWERSAAGWSGRGGRSWRLR